LRISLGGSVGVSPQSDARFTAMGSTSPSISDPGVRRSPSMRSQAGPVDTLLCRVGSAVAMEHPLKWVAPRERTMSLQSPSVEESLSHCDRAAPPPAAPAVSSSAHVEESPLRAAAVEAVTPPAVSSRSLEVMTAQEGRKHLAAAPPPPASLSVAGYSSAPQLVPLPDFLPPQDLARELEELGICSTEAKEAALHAQSVEAAVEWLVERKDEARRDDSEAAMVSKGSPPRSCPSSRASSTTSGMRCNGGEVASRSPSPCTRSTSRM